MKGEKRGRVLLAKLMTLIMIMNLLSGLNLTEAKAEVNDAKHFNKTLLEKSVDGVKFTEEASNYDEKTGIFDVKLTVEGDTVESNVDKSLDVVLVVDTTNSMAGNKIKSAKAAAKEFANGLIKGSKGAKVAVVRASKPRKYTYTEAIVGLTNNVNSINNVIDNDLNAYSGSGGDDITNGLKVAQDLLANSQASQKRIVLITDSGEDIFGSGSSADELKELAASIFNKKIDITAISISSQGRELLSEISRNDYYTAEGAEDKLTEILSGLKEKIKSEKVKNGSLSVTMTNEVSYKGELAITGYGKDGKKSESITRAIKSAFLSEEGNGKISLEGITLGKGEKLEISYKALLPEQYRDGKGHDITAGSPSLYTFSGSDKAITFDEIIKVNDKVKTPAKNGIIKFTLVKKWSKKPADGIEATFNINAEETDVKVPSQVLSKDNTTVSKDGRTWQKQVILPKYDKNDKEIEYTISEESLEGYVSETEKNFDGKIKDKGTVIFINSELINISVTKDWGEVPEFERQSVTVGLFSDNEAEPEDTITLTEADNWKGEFSEVKDIEGGYTVREIQINDQEISEVKGLFKTPIERTGVTGGEVKLTNSLDIADPSEGKIKVVKHWGVDAEKKKISLKLYSKDAEGKWVEKATKELSGNATVLSEEFDLTKLQTDVKTPAKEAENKEISEPKLELKEDKESSKLKEESEVDKDSHELKIKSEEETSEVVRSLDLENGQMEGVSKEAEYCVLETAIEGETPLDEDEINDLLNSNEKFLSYKIGAYDVFVSRLADNKVLIKNAVENEMTKVKVTKNWGETLAEYRLPVKVSLYMEESGNLIQVGKPKNVNNKTLQANFNGLKKFNEDGSEIKYLVAETAVGNTEKSDINLADINNGYSIGNYEVKIENADGNVTIFNSYKKVEDNGNKDGGNGDNGNGGNGGGYTDVPNSDTPVVTIPDNSTPQGPSVSNEPELDITDDTTPQGGTTEDAEYTDNTEDDEDDTADDNEDEELTEIVDDVAPKGKVKEEVIEEPVTVETDITPKGDTKLPKTGGTAEGFLSVIGMGLIGLGFVFRKRR